MKAQRLLIAALVCLAASPALAASNITPIPEFNGDIAEGFENIFGPGGYPGPIDIFGGEGTFDDSLAHYIQLAYSLYSFPSDTYIYPYNGNLMGGSVTGWAVFAFDTPIYQFGGYIGTADVLAGSTVTFRNPDGALIDSFSLTIPLGEWQWHGWQSDTAIGSVEIFAAPNPGLPLVFDDMQASYVPEPASLSLLAVAGALLLGRRH